MHEDVWALLASAASEFTVARLAASAFLTTPTLTPTFTSTATLRAVRHAASE